LVGTEVVDREVGPGDAGPTGSAGARRIYVAASWRTPIQPQIVAALRGEGFEVYDFRNPAPPFTTAKSASEGFSWREIDPEWQRWSPREYVTALAHPMAVRGFATDMRALQMADTVILLQPSGRSAALELGWACGAGKRTAVLLADGQEPELMLRMADLLTPSLDEIVGWLRAHRLPSSPGPTGTAGEPSERIVRHPNGHLMVERTAPYVPSREQTDAALASLAKAWPVLAQHAPHIDGEFDLALTDLRRMVDALRAAAASAAPAGGPDVLLPWLRHHWTCGVNEGGACGCGLESAIRGAAPASPAVDWKQRYEEEAAAHRLAHAQWLEVRAERDALRGAAPASPAVREAWTRIDAFCRKRIAGPTATVLDDLRVVAAALAAEGEP
jgi:hypothetical protein